MTQPADLTGQSTPAPPDSNGKVYVRDQSGAVFDVNTDEAAKAFGQGYRPASGAEVDEALKRQEFGTGTQQLRTALERMAGTATFGGSDYLASQIDPGLADEMRYRSQVNPGAAGVGKVAGFLAPGAAAKLFKGAGVLGEAAELAAAPTEALGRAGEFAESLTSGLVGEGATSTLGRAFEAGLPAAARFGTEGALIGAGDAVTEASLGPDHDLTAEKILAGASDGFGVGALMGGGLGALGSLAGDAKNAVFDRVRSLVSPKDVEALAERQFGEAAPGLGEAWAKATAAASGKDIDAIRDLGIQNLSPEAREARRVAVYEGDAIRDEAKRAIRDQIDELNSSTRNLQEEYMGGLKADHVDASIRKGKEALGQQVEFAQSHVSDIRDRVTAMLGDKDAYGQVADLKKLDRFLNVADRSITDSAEAGNGTQAYIALDDLKKKLGRLARPGSFLSTSSDMAVSQEVRGLYENLRQGLEDEGMWGKAAIDQQTINKAWSKYIDTKGLFEQRLSTPLGRDVNNPWVRQLTADPAKIDAYVNGLTSPKNDLVHQTIKDHIANSQELANALSTLSDIGPEKLAEVGKVFRSADAFGKTVDEAGKSLALTNQLRALEAGGRGGFGSVAGILGGAAFGGPLGAVAGLAGSALSNPGQAVRQLAAIERIGSKLDGDMANTVKAFASKAVKVASEAASTVGDAAARSVVEKRTDALYHQTIAQLSRAGQSPEDVADRASRMIGHDLASAAPNVSAAVTKKSIDTLNYLKSKAPMVPPASPLAPMARRAEPSDMQMQQFNQIVRAAKDPKSVITDFKAGKLTPQAVETMRRLSPKLHEQFVGMLATKVGELAEKGKELPYDQKIDLWMLTGQPVDGTFDPGFIASIQAMHQKQRGNKQAGDANAAPSAPKRKIDIADDHMTALEKLESG